MFRNEDDFKKLIGRISIDTTPDPAHRENLRRQMLSVFNATHRSRFADTRRNMGRIIVQSKVTRLAAAAIIIIAILIGIHRSGSPFESPAFADIVRPLLTARTATFDLTIEAQGQPTRTLMGMFMEPGKMCMVSPEGRVICDMQPNATRCRIINLVIPDKKAIVIEVENIRDDQDRGQYNMFLELKRRIQEAQQLDDDSVEFLGKQQIDGRPAIGYHVRKPDLDITVWADAKTLLPIRLEYSIASMAEAKVTMSNFAFDVELDESLFAIPKDYKVQTMQHDVSKPTEKGLIETFRIWAEHVDGRFPSALKQDAMKEFVRTYEKKFVAEFGKGHKLSDEQQQQLLIIFGKIQRGFSFVESLPPESDSHYAGKDVKLGDPNAAIFWYLPQGSQTYRVIYADLSARDVVPPIILPEPGEKTAPVQEATEASEPKVSVEEKGCKGQVKDKQGRPIADATVLLYHNRNRWSLGNRIVEETVADANGRFIFKSAINFMRIVDHPRAQDSYAILAAHPDYAFGWCNIRQGREQPGYEVTLTSPDSRTMTVTDHNENPLAGVRVWPYIIGDKKSQHPVLRDYLRLCIDVGLIGAVTDANGQAVITNLPKTECRFRATLAGYATGRAFPGTSHIRLSRGADVYGRVLTEDETPLQGATVRFRAEYMVEPFLAKTDSEGYFTFEDLPAKGWDMSGWGLSDGASGSYEVSVEHGTYTATAIQLQLLPDEVIEDLTIDVHGGTLIRCLVVETDTNTPMAGAQIWGNNEKIGEIDGYSDANGVFTLRVPGGETRLKFGSPPDGLYVLRDVNGPELTLFDAQGREMTVTVKAPPIAGQLVSVRGIVLDPNGCGQPEVVVYAAGRFIITAAGAGVAPARANDDGEFELKQVPAGRKLCVYAETNDRRFAGTGVLQIPAEPNEPPFVEIRLVPTQKASVIIKDEAGDPVANVPLHVRAVVDGEMILYVGHDGTTDAQGLLEITGIMPGLEYCLWEEFGSARRRGEAEKSFEGTRVLIPLESDPNSEPAENPR